MVLAEAPGAQEEDAGQPLVGASGILLNQTFKRFGRNRGDFSFGNVIACRPPGNELAALLAKLRATNRKRAKQGLDPLPTPMECCAPRLYTEMAPRGAFLALGALAYRTAVPASQGGIEEARGAIREVALANWMAFAAHHVDAEPMTADGAPTKRRVLATLHPAHVLRFPRWTRAFQGDIKRAIEFFDGNIKVRKPVIHLKPTIAQIEAFLAQTPPWWTWDVETELTRRVRNTEKSRLVRPLEVELRCIGIGVARGAVLVIPILSVDGITRYWQPYEEEYIAGLLKKWALSKTAKIGWNSRWFDRLVFESWTERELGERITLEQHVDLIVGHRDLEPEMRHSLAYAASTRANTHAWKEEHTAVNAQDDNTLHVYNGIDIGNTDEIAPGIFRELRQEKLEACFKVDQEMIDVCAGMHRLGILINQEGMAAPDGTEHVPFEGSRADWAHKLLVKIEEARKDFMAAVAITGRSPLSGWGPVSKEYPHGAPLNPGSTQQLGALLYSETGFDLPPPDGLPVEDVFTDTGERSTSGAVVRAYLASPQTPSDVCDVLEAVRQYRKYKKLYGTYVEGMRYAPTEDTCWLSVDGRVHAGWSAHGTGIGRVACSSPNLANVPGKKPVILRTMYCAAPGNVFVGADFAALHLIIIANLWGIPSLVEAFALGKDPHALGAGVFFGDDFWNAVGQVINLGYPESAENGKYEGSAKNMRSTAKTLRYAAAYGAIAETILASLRKLEDETGKLMFLKMTLEYVKMLLANMHETEPEWHRAWEAEVAYWRTHGFTVDPILGRRYYGRDGEDFNQIVNARVFMTETAIANTVTTELFKQYPPEFAGPGTGMVHQNYDSIMFEVPEKLAPKVAGDMADAMNRTWHKLGSIPTKAEVKIGKTWAEV